MVNDWRRTVINIQHVLIAGTSRNRRILHAGILNHHRNSEEFIREDEPFFFYNTTTATAAKHSDLLITGNYSNYPQTPGVLCT